MYVTLNDAKKQLLIDSSFTDDDVYINGLIDIAENAVSRNINIDFMYFMDTVGEIPPSIKAAILLLVGNLYANREPVSYSSVNKVPYTYDYLISLYKNYDSSNGL